MLCAKIKTLKIHFLRDVGKTFARASLVKQVLVLLLLYCRLSKLRRAVV